MRNSATSLALLGLPILAHAVTLSDFASGEVRNNDKLSNACNAVYFQDITGCAPEDFQSPPCSKGCVNALVGLIGPVYAACHNDGLKGPSILFQYLNNNGPEALCQNDAAVSSAASSGYAALQTGSSSAAGYGSATSSPQSTAVSSTSTPATTSSIAAPTTLTISSSSSASSLTDASATSSAASTSSTISSTATSLVVDTSSSPSVRSTASSTSSSEGSSQTDSNDGSGGGSPFDTVNNGSSAASTFTSSTLALLLAAAGAMLALR